MIAAKTIANAMYALNLMRSIVVPQTIASETARGPGSFEPAFLDALDRVCPAEIATRARVAYAQG